MIEISPKNAIIFSVKLPSVCRRLLSDFLRIMNAVPYDVARYDLYSWIVV